MTNIDELVEIIKDYGGAASIDEIIKGYQKKHPMVILSEHKAIMLNTLQSNPGTVSFNEKIGKWELKASVKVSHPHTAVAVADGSREEIVKILSQVIEGTEAQLDINYKDHSADIINIWKNGDRHKSGFAKNKRDDLFSAFVNNEYATQIAKIVEFPIPTREKAGQQYYRGLTFQQIYTIVCVIAGRYELIKNQ